MRTLLLAVVVIAAGYFGSKLYIQHKVASDLDAVLTQIRPFAAVSYGSVTASMNGELAVDNVTIRLAKFDDPIKVKAVTLETPGFGFLLGFDDDDFEMPERFGVELTGLRTPIDADFLRKIDELARAERGGGRESPGDMCTSSAGVSSPAALRSVGYSEMVMNLRVAFRRNGNGLDLEVATHTEDMYDLDFAVKLADLADPTALARGAQPRLIEARVDYVDRSLNARILKQCTEVHGVPVEQIVAAQLQELQTIARGYGMELNEPILAPYTEFILGKEHFTLTAKPNRPVDLTRLTLYKPSDVPNLLNLMAEVH